MLKLLKIIRNRKVLKIPKRFRILNMTYDFN